MKLTVCLLTPLVALALPTGSRAAAPDASDNPYANLDPDGVPLYVTQGQQPTASSDQMEVQKQEAEQASRAQNWLLLEYEQQFRHDAQATSLDHTLNMYLQLSMNRDVASVTSESTSAAANTPPPALHATPRTTSTQNGVSLRPDGTSSKYNFAPLVSPFNSSIAASASQPYSSGSAYAAALPPGLAPTASLDAPTPAPAPHREPSPVPTLPSLPNSPSDTIDMQTPGMIADKIDPMPGMPNLNLDSLPDPTSSNAQNQQQPPELPELQQPMDAGLLHQQEMARTAPAKPASLTQKSSQPTPAPAPPPLPPETPTPIAKQPQLSPVHAPVPSPFDILTR